MEIKEELSNDIIAMFSNMNVYHGVLERKSGAHSILFRLCYYNSYLHFLIYDYMAIYYSKQTNHEIQKMNASLNPSLEFSEVNSLISFLTDSIMTNQNIRFTEKKGKNSNRVFTIEILVEILTVKWIFDCCEVQNDDNELAQSLFIKPVNNSLITFGMMVNKDNEILGKNILKYSEVLSLVGENFIEKKRGFTTLLSSIIKESSMKINKNFEVIKEGKEIKGVKEKKESSKKEKKTTSSSKKNSKKSSKKKNSKANIEKDENMKGKESKEIRGNEKEDIKIDGIDSKNPKSKKRKKIKFI